MVALGLSKAFESLDPTGIIKSLESSGFDKLAIELMANDIVDGRQLTNINGKKSSINTVFHGVPQGSVLGPLLFSRYINELASVVKIYKISQYADDTTVYCSAKNPEDAQAALQYDLERICA